MSNGFGGGLQALQFYSRIDFLGNRSWGLGICPDSYREK
jgi:hypothetical protein